MVSDTESDYMSADSDPELCRRMAEADIKKLVASKGQCKATITRAEKWLAESQSFMVEDLQVRRQSLKEAITKYQDIVVELLVLEQAVDDSDETENRYLSLLAVIEQKLNSSNSQKDRPNGSNFNSAAKLPALDIPIFDGCNIASYRPFIEMFQAIVDQDSRISDIQRLCFLKKYLKGESLQIIDNLPITGDSYTSALELLKKRYDNPALLISSQYVSSLLDISDVQRGTAQQLRNFVAAVRQHCTALNNLKQPVSQWDAMLSCVLLRKLDPFTVRLFHADRDTTTVTTVDELLSFLDKRAACLESSPVSLQSAKVSKNSKPTVSLAATSNVATTSNIVKDKQCEMCSQVHKLHECPKFNALTLLKRVEFVNKNNLCKICLKSHIKKCWYSFKCSVCNSSTHNTLIHTEEQAERGAQEGECDKKVNHHISQPANDVVLLPTAKVVVTGANNKKFVVRALLDCGSQVSFCTTALANQLGLPQIDMNKKVGTLGDVSNNHSSKGLHLSIESLVHDFKLNVTCSIIPKITSKLPQKQIDLSNFIIPKHISLADTEFHVPGEISLLLASDVFFKIVLDGKIEGGPADPILLNTQLGYVVSSTGYSNSNTAVTMHAVVEPKLDYCVRQFWEAEKIPEVYPEGLPEHERSEMVFTESVSLQNNTFEVKIPLKVPLHDIDPSNSYAIALQRLYSVERRFSKDPLYYKLYKDFIHEYLDLGHAKIIDINNCDPKDIPLFFLPHHAVLRFDRLTNKLRVVFDGSVKTKNGVSLNDVMCKGPVVQSSLFDILLLFRTYKYTIQCDVRHMYRMIQIHPDHRCLQNILWREDGVMQVLQLQTVTYGLTGSPFLATRCLIELAQRFKDEYPLASQAIINSSYVDDIQSGHDTFEGLVQLKNELISLMSLANFKLHKWVSNSVELLKQLPQESLGFKCTNLDLDKAVVKILGLSYDAHDDVFKLSGQVVNPIKKPSKRSVLSSVSRLFDPMGFAGPVTMKAKIILKELWEHNLDWDTPLPNDLLKIWEQFYVNLINIPDIKIPRYLQLADSSEVQLVGYCDAATLGYGCCVYVKVKVNGKFHVHLLCSKSRLAGINSKLTIPKLELNGALLLAKLISHVAITLNISNVNLFCDSKIVLSWLATPSMKVPAYIGNRVKEINKLTQNMSWHFTPGLFNPADILSRGCNPQEFANNSLWMHGPDYLIESNNYNFYMSEIELPIVFNDYETEVCCTVTNNEPIHPFFEQYSSLFKTICIMAQMLRFINKCRKCNVSSGQISVSEFRTALMTIIKGIQIHYFAEELKRIEDHKDLKSDLKSLNVFRDSFGVLRVGGRLNKSNLDFSQKHPIILPKHCHLTKLVIRQEHLALKHGGLKLVLGSLLQKYYIINAVREVKSIIHKCVTCCKLKAEASKQLMGSLPRDRVNPARVFEKVGLDYCGPFEIKQSSKRNTIITKGYVAVFVCFVTKAVHLEVVSDMTTDTFLAAFKRFASRRGLPSDVYCDNATTFKGANNKLKELFTLHKSPQFQNKVQNYALQKEISFHFIPTYSPNHGGLWEAAVKSAKFHLKRIANCKTFTYEQFNTIMIEIEGILNSRPLIPLTQDLTDFTCLTPGHFIIGCALTSAPQPDLTTIPSNRLRFWRCCEQIRQHFWKAWSRDYLTSLNQRTKWRKEMPNLKEGTLVLLIEPNVQPLHWPLGRVDKIYLGDDNKVRVVQVQTSNGKLHSRAVSKIVVLPVE